MKIDIAGNISDKVVEVLASERKRQNMSCYKLAKICGLSKTSIGLIERFENKPTLRTLIMISSALKANLGEIIQNILENEKNK